MQHQVIEKHSRKADGFQNGVIIQKKYALASKSQVGHRGDALLWKNATFLSSRIERYFACRPFCEGLL
ncbi:MAG: hypothetical protein ABFD81_02880 [Syntrophaceae bacterium]